MVPRSSHQKQVLGLLRRHPVVGLIGARQVGKTTLARALASAWKAPTHWFDLEDPTDLARLDEAMLALRALRGLVIIDEIQRRPELFPVLRVLVDRPRRPARFLILGSASPGLLRQSSESLAGRIAFHDLGGFGLDEVGVEHADRLWLRGGFPRSFLARSEKESLRWRGEFLRTFLERDLLALAPRLAPSTLRRFWTMLAHYHGQTWNASEFARSFGMSDTSVRRYLDTLTSTFMVRQLQPWRENLKKRQVASPRIYVADSGLLHALLGLRVMRDVEGHPKLGASWEGFALEQVVRRLGAETSECFFWATHSGAELDLFVRRGGRRLGFEFKRTLSPKRTRSMESVLRDLRLGSLDVVYPGEKSFPIGPKIRAVPLRRLAEDVPPLG